MKTTNREPKHSMPSQSTSVTRAIVYPIGWTHRCAHLATGILFALLLMPATAAIPEGESAAVLQVVTAMFDGMRSKDAALLGEQFAPDAIVGTQAAQAFIEAVVNAPAYLDEVTFNETVMIDKDLAIAWTPYRISVDGKLAHCGVNVFVMREIDRSWKITFLDDSRRTEGCALEE